MKKLFVYISFLSALLGACIPIEDHLNPELAVTNKGKIEIQDTDTVYTYEVGDTIKAIAVCRDNERIDSIIVKSDNPTLLPYSRYIPGGRLFRDTVKIRIPADTPLGTYTLTITCVDYGKNRTVVQQRVKIQDTSVPAMEGVGVDVTNVDLIPVRDASGNIIYYQTCQGNRINMTGIVSDNRALRSFKVTISRNNAVLTGDSVEIANARTLNITDLFRQNFRINVPQVPGNTALQLKATVIDINANSSSRTFELKVECDIVPPVITGVRTTIPSSREMIEGANFQVTAGTVTDNQFIKNLYVTIKQGNTVVSQQTIAVNSPSDVSLGTLLRGKTFSLPDYIPERSSQDNEYVLLIEADDRNLRSAPDTTFIRVVQDKAPVFDIARYEAFLDSAANRIDLGSSLLTIAPGQKLYVRGIKARDDYSLDSVKVYWGTGATLKKAVKVPSQITIYEIQQDVYEVPTSAISGSTYILRFVAYDRKAKAGRAGEATERRYTFRVR